MEVVDEVGNIPYWVRKSEIVSQMVTYLVCDELKYGFKSAYEQS